MKKIILTSTLLTSLAVATIATATSINSQTSQVVEQKNDDTPIWEPIEEPKEEPVEESNSSTVTIHFAARVGQTVSFVGATTSKITRGKPFGTAIQPNAFNEDGDQLVCWEYEDHEKINDWDLVKPTGNELTVYPYFGEVNINNCVGLAAIQNSTVSFVNHGGNNPNIQYSYSGLPSSFETYVDGQTLTIAAGQTIYFKGRNNGFSKSDAQYTSFQIGGAVNLNGNITSLLDDGQGELVDINHDYCFYGLFEGCSGIATISSKFFPDGKLSKFCYAYLFKDCTCLTEFPNQLLPVEILTKTTGPVEDQYDGTCCYTGMFMNCTGLEDLPSNLLPATTLSNYCYRGMFEGCTGLTELPDGLLPAQVLTYGCYYGMFDRCTSLTKIGSGTAGTPFLPAEQLNANCYANMFSTCTSLVNAPKNLLPDTELSSTIDPTTGLDHDYYCYGQMFYGCIALEVAPNLPATTLSSSCYNCMFYNCHNLTDAGLPTFAVTADTNLRPNCFRYMFYNCSDLTTIPPLPSTRLASYCYSEMFVGCKGITDGLSSYNLPATIAAEHCYDGMFRGCNYMTVTPSISLTTLANSCCYGMFAECYSLISTPELLAVTAVANCYTYMFRDCALLERDEEGHVIRVISGISVVAPIHLSNFDETTSGCCSFMFDGCRNLHVNRSGRGTAAFITIPYSTDGINATTNMFQDTGTFPDAGGYTQNYGTWYYGAD